MKILVIEDDLKIATNLKRGLEAEGFVVEIALDGTNGLWRGQERTYDVIICDLMLPGRNGFQICADLRRAGVWTPILVLTAKDGEYDETEALDTGADDYLTKPFSFAVLIARVHALLRRSNVSATPPLDVGNLRVDPASRRVWLDGVEVALTSREFDVIALLARRSGQVLSKSEIIAAVWHDDFDGDLNIVEVYVRRLRRKLADESGASPIVTIRGAGYRLDHHTPVGGAP